MKQNGATKTRKLSNNKKRQVDQLVREASHAYLGGRFIQVEQLCKKIFQVQVSNPDACNLLGLIAEQRGDWDGARELYLRGREGSPKHLGLCISLAQLHQRNGDFEASVPLLQNYLNHKPSNPDVWHILARAWSSLRLFDRAEAAVLKALKLAPNRACFHSDLGQTLLMQFRYSEGIACFRRALELEPENVDIWYNLAKALTENGDMDDAVEAFRSALALNPSHALSIFMLLRFRKVHDYSDDMKRAEELFCNDATPIEDKKMLAFALGKAWEDLKDYDKSFAYYAEANRLYRSGWEYDIESTRAQFQGIKKLFSEELFSKHNTESTNGEEFLFIVGMPRSGSTLLSQILTAHPKAIDVGESGMLREAVGKHAPAGCGDIDLTKLINMLPEQLVAVAEEYRLLIHRLFGQSEVYVDKSLPNFLLVGVIRLLLPGAKIVHCSRNPLDNCLSIFSNPLLGSEFKYAYTLQEIAEYYRIYLDLMEHWRKLLPADVFYDISNEDLIAAPEMETRRLVEFCGLEWNDACLSFHKSKVAVKTLSMSQVRQPINSSSLRRWKRYEKHLQPLIDALGDVAGNVE